MDSPIKNKEQETRIVNMSPINRNTPRAPNPLEKDLCQISNCLEEVYQDLNELDEIIDESFRELRK